MSLMRDAGVIDWYLPGAAAMAMVYAGSVEAKAVLEVAMNAVN
jgi:hypothetical protein